jgi:hypothetical protein
MDTEFKVEWKAPKIPYFELKGEAKCKVKLEGEADKKAAEAATKKAFDDWRKGGGPGKMLFPALAVAGNPHPSSGTCRVVFSGKSGATHVEFTVTMKDCLKAEVPPFEVKFPPVKVIAGKAKITLSPELDVTLQPEGSAIAKMVFEKYGGGEFIAALGKPFLDTAARAGLKVVAADASDMGGPIVVAAFMGYEGLFKTLCVAVPGMVSDSVMKKDIKQAKEAVGVETSHCFHAFQHGVLGMGMQATDNPQAFKKGQEMRPKLLASVRQKHPNATEEQIQQALFKNPKVNQLYDNAFRQLLGKVRQEVWSDYVKTRKNDWAKCEPADRDLIWKAIWGDLPEPKDPRFVNFTS